MVSKEAISITINRKLSILAIGAHPDDMEIRCGGTLAKYANLGHNVTICYVTSGGKGHATIPPEDLVEIREREASNACKILNVKPLFLRFEDGEVYLTKELVTSIIDAIRSTKADIIITLPEQDYHMDHINVSIASTNAFFLAGVPHLKTNYPAYKPQKIYYCETTMGLDFIPDFYIDITDSFDIKLKALAEHKSQCEWLKRHHNVDLLQRVKVMAEFRGLQCGTKYAEAFQFVRRHMTFQALELLP